MNKELAKTLTLALVNYIDENRPEGTMDCSNTECAYLESAFLAENFIYIEDFIQKKLLKLSEFEQEVSDIVEYCKEHGEVVAFDYAKRHAKTLLDLAKKEILINEWHKVFSEEVKAACTNKCTSSSDFYKFLDSSNN